MLCWEFAARFIVISTSRLAFGRAALNQRAEGALAARCSTTVGIRPLDGIRLTP